VIIFRFDETDRAIATLMKNNVKILEGERLYSM
jgi:hypothetical protein